MSSYPSGTVTFLFTDIEGSTKLAQNHPDAWENLRRRHHTILQSAMEVHKGYVFQIIGDGFCVAFYTASDGLRAAVDVQLKLKHEEWGEAPIKVRMGLHTGSAEHTGSDYRGYLTMAKVQRVMSVAYGGQVLLSNTSAELLHNELPGGISLRDMKEHRLKGLQEPERLWQIIGPGLQKDFPPLQSLTEIPSNLPLQLTSFIGREKEVEQIKKRLKTNRLVTLTGSGGVGKTRLSIQVVSELLDEYPHGVWLVELAPITDPALVTQAVCAVLDITPQGNVPALNVLTEYLKSKKILLVLDNCEHLIDACAQLCNSLVHACPDLRMIASSRQALGIDGENTYRVPSLSLPHLEGDMHAIEESEAVKLFIERATATLSSFELTQSNARIIAQICQRLNGIPLAIELAASRVKILKLKQIASRLDDAFRLLTGGSRTVLPRHQTLRGAIDWSYNLLGEEERIVFRRLSVFAGGWNLDAAEAIYESPDVLDLLANLVDKSLVTVDHEHRTEARYYLLETIRQYAGEKLAESGEGEHVHARHLDYFLKLAQRAEPELYRPDQIEWLQKLDDENANLHAALDWSLPGDVIAGQQLAGALWWFWDISGQLSEGYKWLRIMLEVSSGDKTSIRGKLLAGAGWLAGLLGYPEQKRELAEKSVALYQELGDKVGIAVPFITLGSIATEESDYDQAIQLLNESMSLFKQAGNHWGVGFVLSQLGTTTEIQGNLELAQKFYQESLQIFKEIGDQEGSAWTLYLMGGLAEQQGSYKRAIELYRKALQIEKVVNSKPVTSWLLECLGQLLIQDGGYEEGKSLFEESLEINRKMGNQRSVARSLRHLGLTELLLRNYLKARSFFAQSLQLAYQIRDEESISLTLIQIGKLVEAQGSSEKFVHLLGIAEVIEPEIQKKLWPPVFRNEIEKSIMTACSVLGDEAYTAAWQSGRQMNLEEAISFALKELQ